ncbi:MAG: hypothetical protein AABW58_04425 [Nanoarchaeota archaeon]
MEALIPVVAFLGIFVGILIAKFTREEIRNNRNYLLILGKIIIGILILVVIMFSKNLSLLFIGVLLGFLSAYVLSEFLFLGLVLGISFFLKKDISLITSSLVFMYALVYGSLIRLSTLSFSRILILFVMFFLPFSIFLVDGVLLIDLVIGFVAGGLSNYLIGNKFALF